MPCPLQVSHIVLLKDPTDPSKLRNYCFVHYEERSSAVRAVDEATDGPKPEMDGKELSVSADCALPACHGYASLFSSCFPALPCQRVSSPVHAGEGGFARRG